MKQIPLTKGKFVIVDDEDYEYLNQWKWKIGYDGYARRNKWLKTINGKRKCINIYMHRIINNTPKGFETDHISGNKLDNRKENLRIATSRQNKRNRGKQQNNTSGYKGVCLYIDKRINWQKWKAQIEVDSKNVNLGYFKTKEDAAKAYNEAARKYFGEFAVLNDV